LFHGLLLCRCSLDENVLSGKGRTLCGPTGWRMMVANSGSQEFDAAIEPCDDRLELPAPEL